jgi:enediyne biosynthesis protein E4
MGLLIETFILNFLTQGGFMKSLLTIWFAAVCSVLPLSAQGIFTRIATGIPLATDGGSGANYYNGCAWIDYDNDGDLDFVVSGSLIYENDVKLNTTTGLGTGYTRGRSTFGFSWSGVSWADFDNDGRIDCAITGAALTVYRNTRSASGSTVFTRLDEAAFPLSASGFACAWADYDNDGFVDIVAAGLLSEKQRNVLYRNNGNGTFARIDTSVISKFDAPFTIPSWSDYDGDGDMDLFFGAGPGGGGNTGPDFLFKNMLKETGKATFERVTTLNIIQEDRDGQIWNWVDYDNDGDLDVYITNYGATNDFTGTVNHLYRNDKGVFTKITDAGELVTDEMASLASVWEDFDNDGDLDCIVTNDAKNPTRYYENLGNGRFTGSDLLSRGVLRYGAAAGDYDNDGDVDVFVVGATTAAKGLMRNDASTNDNAWFTLHCVGVRSNRSAIGAKVRIKATINGKAIWQMREISAQNSFQGHNMLSPHFGVGRASVVDSVIVEWPSGAKEVLVNIPTKQILTITEGRGLTTEIQSGNSRGYAPELLRQNAPNPFSSSTSIGYVVPAAAWVRLAVYDALGNEIAVLVDEMKAAGEYSTVFQHGGASGTLFAQVRVGAAMQVRAILALQP